MKEELVAYSASISAGVLQLAVSQIGDGGQSHHHRQYLHLFLSSCTCACWSPWPKAKCLQSGPESAIEGADSTQSQLIGSLGAQRIVVRMIVKQVV